jgi:hypothetical protein
MHTDNREKVCAMTLHQLPRENALRFHFVPQAVIDRSPGFFAAKGAEFEEGRDDFDDFVVSSLTLDSGLPFALLRYNSSPDNKTTVFLPQQVPLARVEPIVEEILVAFGLSISAVNWVRKQKNTSF